MQGFFYSLWFSVKTHVNFLYSLRKMDFSSLPDNVFLQIFHCLRLRDQIRIGGVSVAFRRMSDIAISETKSLDLNDDALKNISPRGFSRLLNLCHDGLRKCNLVECGSRGWLYHQCIGSVFTEHSYPQLNTLGFDGYFDNVIYTSLHQYVSSLRSSSVLRAINFPYVIMERLETLDLRCNDLTIQTFMGKMPNLVHLKVRDKGVSYRTLDSFLGTVPLLESFHVLIERDFWHDGARPLDLEGNGMTAFWQLKSLNRFEVSYCWLYKGGRHDVMIGDKALIRIAQSFPGLCVLSLCYASSGKNGVAALSSLQGLRELALEEVDVNIDMELRGLSKCEYLEKLIVTDPNHNYVKADTASTLLRSCPRLSFIACGHIVDISSIQDAVAFITSLAVLKKRVITIQIGNCRLGRFWHRIWASDEVKDALKELEEVAAVVAKILWFYY